MSFLGGRDSVVAVLWSIVRLRIWLSQTRLSHFSLNQFLHVLPSFRLKKSLRLLNQNFVNLGVPKLSHDVVNNSFHCLQRGSITILPGVEWVSAEENMELIDNGRNVVIVDLSFLHVECKLLQGFPLTLHREIHDSIEMREVQSISQESHAGTGTRKS